MNGYMELLLRRGGGDVDIRRSMIIESATKRLPKQLAAANRMNQFIAFVLV